MMCSVQNGSVHNALNLPVCTLFHLLPGIVGLSDDPTSFSTTQDETGRTLSMPQPSRASDQLTTDCHPEVC